jgi:hypothetical protein
MSQKHLVVPHFIGPASLTAAEHESLTLKEVALPDAIGHLNSRARSNIRRAMAAAWVTEALVKSGEDVRMGLFEGWRGHEVKQYEGMRINSHILTGADFEFLLLQQLQERGIINVALDRVIRDPVARCTLEEARGIRSKAMDLLQQYGDTVTVVSIADQAFSPARWRLQQKLDVVMERQPHIEAEAYSVDQVVDAYDIPLSNERQQCLEASRLSRFELAQELLEEGKAAVLHHVSEIQRWLYQPEEGREVEVLLAHRIRPDRK